MSIYDNESKMYPYLNPTTPQGPKSYGLQNLTEIEHICLMKMKFVNRLPKK